MPIDAAVFSRNHRHYLEEATKVAETDPDRLIAFRSSVSWARARQELASRPEIPVYFAVIDDGPQIQFEADLVSVHLRRTPRDPEAKQLIYRYQLPSTAGEGLWDNDRSSVATVYLIKRCRRRPSISMTHLVKISDGRPLASNYGYGYSIVYKIGSEPKPESSSR